MKNRTNKILALLIKHKKMDVAELAKQLQVSQVTIRKDLTQLVHDGDTIMIESGSCILPSKSSCLAASINRPPNVSSAP